MAVTPNTLVSRDENGQLLASQAISNEAVVNLQQVKSLNNKAFEFARNILQDSAFKNITNSSINSRIWVHTNGGYNFSIAPYDNDPSINKVILTSPGTTGFNFIRHDNTSLIEGETYTIAAFIKCDDPDLTGIRLGFASNGTPNSNMGIPVLIDVENGWKFAYYTFVASGTLTGLRVQQRDTTKVQVLEVAYLQCISGSFIQPVMYTSSQDIGKSVSGIITQFRGLDLAVLGDSLVPVVNNTETSPFPVTTANNWLMTVANKLGFNKVYPLGWGGSTYKQSSGTGWVSTQNGRLLTAGTNPQPPNSVLAKSFLSSFDRISKQVPRNFWGVIVIFAGHNDAFGQANDSDLTSIPRFIYNENTDPEWVASEFYGTGGNLINGDFDITEYTGAVCSCIMKLQAWCPEATIVVCTPASGRANPEPEDPNNWAVNSFDKTMRDYADATILACKVMGVPCIDINATDQINMVNRSRYISDEVHPNQRGYERVARALMGGLMNVFPTTNSFT